MLNLLDLRPVRRRHYKLNEKKGDGTYIVLVPKFGSSKLGRWLTKKLKNPNYFINLDEFGTFVWDMCDGEKQVREIANALKVKYAEKVDPVYDRLSMFLKQMEKAQLIAFKETAKENIVPTSLGGAGK